MGDALAGISFTAIDFETANSNRGSVCAVGLAKVENGRTVESASWLIRPPAGIHRFDETNVRIHGIRAADVVDALDWHASVALIAEFMGKDHLVAYNATFDASVMRKASEHVNLTLPGREFYCAMKLAQQHLDLPGHKLPAVAAALNVAGFTHHDAAADAQACAEVVLAIAAREGFSRTADIWGRPTSAIGDLYPLRNVVRRPGAPTIRTHVRKDDLPQANVHADPDHPFYGAVFCFTGDLETYSRAEAMARVAERGASSGNTVTKKTTYVVIGEENASKSLDPAMLAGTGKARKATLYKEAGQGIAVICERDFLVLLDGRPAALAPSPVLDGLPVVFAPGPVRAAFSPRSDAHVPAREPAPATAPQRRTPVASRTEPGRTRPIPAAGGWSILATVVKSAWKLLGRK